MRRMLCRQFKCDIHMKFSRSASYWSAVTKQPTTIQALLFIHTILLSTACVDVFAFCYRKRQLTTNLNSRFLNSQVWRLIPCEVCISFLHPECSVSLCRWSYSGMFRVHFHLFDRLPLLTAAASLHCLVTHNVTEVARSKTC